MVQKSVEQIEVKIAVERLDKYLISTFKRTTLNDHVPKLKSYWPCA